MLRHPFEGVPATRRIWFWLAGAAATVAVMLVFNLIGAPTITPAAPQGIVSLQLAGSAEAAEGILASWDSAARLRAAFGLGLDFLFPLLYAATIGSACVWAAGALRPVWPGLAAGGVLLAWEMWLAALFDYLENIALTAILFGPVQPALPEIARALALLKFCLIGVALVYVALGTIIGALRLIFRR
ncbi:MAG TPA: hypothetical protein VJJ70_12935 [Anaerolineales bacterium]|nr:hypothetical protein [Anaerolineales bacterium]